MNNIFKGLDEELSVFRDFRTFFNNNPDALLGYVMELGYEDGTVITNDFYKLRNQGIPKNSFIIIKLIDTNIAEGFEIPEHYILARVKEPTTTPLSSDVSRTYFELHKNHMPEIDIFTKAELQWSALKISVLGTYYENEREELEYAGDIESYFSPHLYEVYRPSNEILNKLINNSIISNDFVIGKLRYTESRLQQSVDVEVKVSVDDFIASRTALFGKTRMGKSNTVKIIAESIINKYNRVGQIIFDLNGEYANKNEQDLTSLFDKYKDNCLRYSVNFKEGLETLKVNMYEDLKLGHQIIKQLLSIDNTKADYLNGFINFELLDKDELETLKQEDMSSYKRYLRHESIYKCVLYKAQFRTDKSYKVNFDIKKDILNTVFKDEYPAENLGKALF
ncbi:MAG: ATP-binding protein [Bacillaceae bacterium]|nr:ATP-binding protein [Bacillaceae bacterium]